MPRALTKTFLRLLAIIIIKKATILKIEPSQKTNYSFGNLYIDNYKFGGSNSLIRPLYLISSPVLKKSANQNIDRLRHGG